MELENELALEGFAESHGGLKRNGEMCFDAESLDELLQATRKLEREACAMVCEKKHNDLAVRSYPAPGILKALAAEIRGRSTVELTSADF